MFESFFSNLLKWDVWVGAFATFIIPFGIKKVSDFLYSNLKNSK